jgi:hypothetical protein
MSKGNLIESINERADAGRWCKRLYCTTCAARDLRAAFSVHSIEEIVDGLKAINHDFILENFDIFLFAAVSASRQSSPEDTLESLGGTPAAYHLKKVIEHHAAGLERSRKYEERNSPEALLALRQAKKARQLEASQPHRDLKHASKNIKRRILDLLNSVPEESLIEVVAENDFEISKRAIGGMVFSKIIDRIRAEKITDQEREGIKFFAREHGGHWLKLDKIISRAEIKKQSLPTLYSVDETPMTEAFHACWYAAAVHLSAQGQGAINWLKATPTPPFLEHLSFRLGNQLFFVRVEDIDEVEIGPGNRGGVISIAEGTGGHACIIYMKLDRTGEWRPATSGWGLLKVEDEGMIDPPSLISEELIEISEWEMQDIAVQVVRGILEDQGHTVESWQGSPHLNPSIWYRKNGVRTWVIVRSCKYPEQQGTLPSEVMSLRQKFEAQGFLGEYGLVSLSSLDSNLASARSSGADSIFRGHMVSAQFRELLPIEQAIKQRGRHHYDPAADLLEGLLHDLDMALVRSQAIPEMFVGWTDHGKLLNIPLASVGLIPDDYQKFMRLVIKNFNVIAYCHVTQSSSAPIAKQGYVGDYLIFEAGTKNSFHRAEVSSLLSEGWQLGQTNTRRWHSTKPDNIVNDLFAIKNEPTTQSIENALKVFRDHLNRS